MIQTAQRKILRLIVQTKRKYKSKKPKRSCGWNWGWDKKTLRGEKKYATDKETEESTDHNSNKDQDSDVSFQEDNDEEIDTTEKEEEWTQYIKRSIKEAKEYRKKTKIPCWIETHKRLNWRMTSSITLLPKERWTSKSSIDIPILTTKSRQEDW